MGIAALCCSTAVIMWDDHADTTRHYMRVNPATGTMIVDKAPTSIGSAYWSRTTGVTITSGQQYVINYQYAVDNTTATGSGWTFSFSSTLKDYSQLYSSTNPSNGCIYPYSIATDGFVVKLRGWAYYRADGASDWDPPVTLEVYEGANMDGTLIRAISGSSLTLSALMSGYAISGLSDDSNYYIRAILTAPNYQIGKAVIKTAAQTSTKGWYVYTGSTNGWVKTTPYVYISYKEIVNGEEVTKYKWIKAAPYVYNGSSWVEGT